MLFGTVGTAERRQACVALYRDSIFLKIHLSKLAQVVIAEEIAHPVCNGLLAAGRQAVHYPSIHAQTHPYFRMGQSLECECRADVGQLGLLTAQKLAACRHVKEEIAHLDPRPRRPADLTHILDLTARERDLGPRDIALAGRCQAETGHRGNGGQRLAPESQRVDVFDVVDISDLAGCVAFDRKQRVVTIHAVSVVADRHQLSAARCNLDIDPGRPRIESVLHQFLEYGCRTFDDLAGRDLVDHVLRKHPYGCLRHGRSIGARAEWVNAGK